ncbi:hypothetical protein OUZ56_009413 [Daphnia magna]|uniref:U1-type domain-containing protein n=1 Tax=Daphnia magna TaxID=35525 RepID=A0ABR0AFX2_9CRUS|nr:hypothetical protein OUZ56_009413 [Daphnia magna]
MTQLQHVIYTIYYFTVQHGPVSQVGPVSPTAYCTVCNTYMQNWKQQLDRQCKTPKHKAAFGDTVKSLKQKKLMVGFTGQSLERKVVESEDRLCTLIGEQNLPFNFVDPLVSVLKKSFPEDPTLAKLMVQHLFWS